MALIPHPREAYNPSAARSGDKTSKMIEDVYTDLEKRQPGKLEALNRMATRIDTTTEVPGLRSLETGFRKLFFPGKTKSVDIIATLVGQQVSQGIHHKNFKFDPKEIAKINQEVLNLIPDSKEEADRIVDELKSFNRLVDVALTNADPSKAEESWRMVSEHYKGVGEHRGIDVDAREKNNKAAQTFLRGQLLQRITDLLDPRTPAEQAQFAQMFEHLDIIDLFKKEDIPIAYDRLTDPNVKIEITKVLERQAATWTAPAGGGTAPDKVRPKVREALVLGILTENELSSDVAQAAAAADTQKGSGAPFEKTGKQLSETGAPYSSYADVRSDAEVKKLTIEKMKKEIEGGTNLQEWLNRIASFDERMKNEILEPFNALPDTVPPGVPNPHKEALKELSQKEVQLKNLKLKGGSYKLIKDLSDRVSTLKSTYNDSARQFLYRNLRRLDDAEVDSEVLPHARKVVLNRLIDALAQSTDWFVELRKEALRERASTYRHYRIVRDADLLDTSFTSRSYAAAITRLRLIRTIPGRFAAERRFMIDNDIIPDTELRRAGL